VQAPPSREPPPILCHPVYLNCEVGELLTERMENRPTSFKTGPLL